MENEKYGMNWREMWDMRWPLWLVTSPPSPPPLSVSQPVLCQSWLQQTRSLASYHCLNDFRWGCEWSIWLRICSYSEAKGAKEILKAFVAHIAVTVLNFPLLINRWDSSFAVGFHAEDNKVHILQVERLTFISSACLPRTSSINSQQKRARCTRDTLNYV